MVEDGDVLAYEAVCDSSPAVYVGALNSCNTRVFVDFSELLDAMNEYYPFFERRFRYSLDGIHQL